MVLGFPNAGADVACEPPNELEPNTAPPVLGAPTVEEGVPQGEAFCPICEAAPKAVGVAEVPKDEEPAGFENGEATGVEDCADVVGLGAVEEPSTAARPGYAVPCLIESV
jgi:hypothetical protein